MPYENLHISQTPLNYYVVTLNTFQNLSVEKRAVTFKSFCWLSKIMLRTRICISLLMYVKTKIG